MRGSEAGSDKFLGGCWEKRGLRVIFGVRGGVVVGMMRWGGCVVYWLVFGGELGSNLMFLVYTKMGGRRL